MTTHKKYLKLFNTHIWLCYSPININNNFSKPNAKHSYNIQEYEAMNKNRTRTIVDKHRLNFVALAHGGHGIFSFVYLQYIGQGLCKTMQHFSRLGYI